MVISRIVYNGCLYYHLHAEQTITATFSEGRSLGIQEKEVTLTTLQKVIDDYKKLETKPKILSLNFDGLSKIQSNSIKKFSELRKLCKSLILINIDESIVKEIGIDDLFSNENNIKKDVKYALFYVSESKKEVIETETEIIFQKSFLNILSENYIDEISEEKMYHASSSVYIPKWINIKKFINNDKCFFLYAIYNLALKTNNHWKKEFSSESEIENSKPVLVCQNLNSSYITSILSSLLRTDILILDQIGPINKIYSTLDSKIDDSKSYLVVSDLVCLGTEVKIAKSLIEFLGGNYIGNISIIRIQTILPDHKKHMNTECSFLLDQENNKKIEYKIKTAFEL